MANLIVNILSENKFINVEEYIMGPSEDIYRCTIHNHEFQFVFDLDYGCWFQSNDLEALDLLIELFFDTIPQ